MFFRRNQKKQKAQGGINAAEGEPKKGGRGLWGLATGLKEKRDNFSSAIAG